jgi:hypothetical protein
MLILGLQIDRVWGFQFTMIKWIYRQTGAKVSFAHHIRLLLKQYLSFGISYNYNNFKIDIDEFNPDFENPVLDPKHHRQSIY